MRFERTLVTRTFDVDRSLVLSPSTVLRYAEHVRWQALTDPAGGLGRVFAGGRRMVIRAQRVVLGKRVGFGVDLRVSATFERVGRTSLDLANTLVTAAGEEVARVLATAVFLGADGRPTPVPDPLREAVEPTGLDAGAPAADLAPPAGAWTRRFTARPSDCDLFQHVNHARYADWLEDCRVLAARDGALGEGPVGDARLQGLALAYEDETRLGEPLELACWRSGPASVAVRGARPDDGRPVVRGELRLALP